MSLRKLMSRLSACLLLCFCVSIAVKGQTTKTVKVDCTKGKSINAALNANRHVFRLTIEIDGICYENVDISDRKRVTLIGDDREEDGIHGVSTDLDGPTRGITIQIGRTAGVTLENLTISGGARHGISVSYSNANTVENCIVEGNAIVGLNVGRASIIRVFNSEITGGTGDRVRGDGVRVDTSSRVELTDTLVVEGSRWALRARDRSTIIMTGGKLEGSVNIANKNILHLFGVEQTDLGARPNRIENNSQLRTNCDVPGRCANQTRLLDTRLQDFSNASFAESALDDLTCSDGSDAVCDDASEPDNSGSTDCSLCFPGP